MKKNSVFPDCVPGFAGATGGSGLGTGFWFRGKARFDYANRSTNSRKLVRRSMRRCALVVPEYLGGSDWGEWIRVSSGEGP